MPIWLRKALPLTIVVLVLFYLFTVDNPSSQLFDIEDKGQVQTAPVFFVTNFESRQYGEHGTVTQTLRGTRADHFQPGGSAGPQDYTVIQALEGEIHQQDGEPWFLRADQGVANAKGQEITLSGQVRLRLQDPVRGVTELSTEKLVYFPKQRLASTDAPVTIVTPDSKTHAVGLNADLEREILTLKKQVRSVHEPH